MRALACREGCRGSRGRSGAHSAGDVKFTTRPSLLWAPTAGAAVGGRLFFDSSPEFWNNINGFRLAPKNKAPPGSPLGRKSARLEHGHLQAVAGGPRWRPIKRPYSLGAAEEAGSRPRGRSSAQFRLAITIPPLSSLSSSADSAEPRPRYYAARGRPFCRPANISIPIVKLDGSLIGPIAF